MIKSLVWNIVLILLLTSGCEDNPVKPETAEDYFPLEKGNKWYYRHFYLFGDTIKYTSDKAYDMTMEVIGEKEINRKDFYAVEGVYENRRNDTSYFRSEYENLFRFLQDYNTGEYSGGVYVNFSLSVGDTFHCFMYRKKYIATVIEKTPNITRIYYEVPQVFDEDLELTFMKNLGLIKYYAVDFQQGYVLTGAEIK